MGTNRSSFTHISEHHELWAALRLEGKIPATGDSTGRTAVLLPAPEGQFQIHKLCCSAGSLLDRPVRHWLLPGSPVLSEATCTIQNAVILLVKQHPGGAPTPLTAPLTKPASERPWGHKSSEIPPHLLMLAVTPHPLGCGCRYQQVALRLRPRLCYVPAPRPGTRRPGTPELRHPAGSTDPPPPAPPAPQGPRPRETGTSGVFPAQPFLTSCPPESGRDRARSIAAGSRFTPLPRAGWDPQSQGVRGAGVGMLHQSEATKIRAKIVFFASNSDCQARSWAQTPVCHTALVTLTPVPCHCSY